MQKRNRKRISTTYEQDYVNVLQNSVKWSGEVGHENQQMARQKNRQTPRSLYTAHFSKQGVL